MRIAQLTRRDFVADASRAATTGWLALQLRWLAVLAGCARDDARKGNGSTYLTPDEARTMRAFAAQIIPSDDGAPGAEEAGAGQFVDRALGMPLFATSAPLIRAGLADLDARARAFGGRTSFASAPPAEQVAIMRQVEQSPFFTAARTLVVTGTFADPLYGGNARGVGWTMLGIDHRPTYAAPFGWYDAQAGTDTDPKRAA